MGQDIDVDECAGRHRQFEHIAVQAGVTQQAPQFAEVPAQRGQRILGILEQQRGQMRPARAGFRAHQVGEQTPHLVAARRRQRLPVALDPRHAQEMDGEAAHESIVAQAPHIRKRELRLPRSSDR
jgi:hypothetical protein